MDFYPVYRLCRTNGSFSRIGSLLAIRQQQSAQVTPQNVKQAEAYFEQKPGEIILLGPRCAPVGKNGLPVEVSGEDGRRRMQCQQDPHEAGAGGIQIPWEGCA